MVRLLRAESFDPSEVAILHVIGSVTRRCFLFGFNPVSGKNFNHRKVWIEEQLKTQPNEFELNSIRNDPEKVTTIRTRLSDVARGCVCSAKTLVPEPTKKIAKLGSFSKVAIRLFEFSMKRRCWLAQPMSTST